MIKHGEKISKNGCRKPALFFLESKIFILEVKFLKIIKILKIVLKPPKMLLSMFKVDLMFLNHNIAIKLIHSTFLGF